MNIKQLSISNREILAKKFIEEVVLPQWHQLKQWNDLTLQTSQIDFGYLAQHLISLLAGIEGNGQRGKGDDLSDGSEVKSASCLDADDTPRWNGVNCSQRTSQALIDKYQAMPYLFFVLIDTTKRGGDILRCRAWVVRPSEDEAFQKVAIGWGEENDIRPYTDSSNGKNLKVMTNFQLHPPRWEKADENITTNLMGNLKLPLFYHSEQLDVPGISVMETIFYNPSIIENGESEYIDR